MTLGEKLYTLRIKQNMTQEQLAEKLQVSRQSISKWESDATRPDLGKLKFLAEFYHVSLDALLDEDVDIFDMNDVMWTINTRFQAHKDIMTLEGMRNHPLDPSELPEYSPEYIRVKGMSSKLVLDGTVPFDMKSEFERAKFKEVPYWKKYLD